jgi:hypothetical protein
MKKIVVFILLLLFVIQFQVEGQVIRTNPFYSGSTTTVSSLLTGLECFYKCDEASGNIIDASANGRTGTPTDITYLGTSLSFNGTSSKFVVSNEPQPTTAMTISFSLKTSSTTGNTKISYSKATSGYILYLDAGSIEIVLDDAGAANELDVYFTGTINDGAWHNIMIVFDGTTVNGYVDNVSKLSEAWAHTIAYEGVNELTVMATNYGAGWVAGELKKFGIWSRAVSSTERAILADPSSNFPW